MAMRAKTNGRGVLVLDPLHDQWPADFQTEDPELFLKTFWQSRSCDVFIDEAGDTVGHYEKPMIQTATKGRHWGHNVYYITQRAASLSPTVRGQCRYIFLFALARQDCEVYAREFNKPELIEASRLPQGACFFAARFKGEVKRFNVFGGKDDESSNDNSGRSDSSNRSASAGTKADNDGSREETRSEQVKD